ncbi:MAG: bifunctional lytic transglycosylase/C40 family peptidase [Hespellia sp.]|nr:bifunctional lytic transglycosylase/C40 family peptidase [Hespellia sp.]
MKNRKAICIIIFCIFLCLQLTGCDLSEDRSDRSGSTGAYGTANVPPLVEQWRDDVEKYARKYGVEEYVELLLAMIAQESGGDADRYPDIMQSSESAGDSPNTISDPQASLDQGIKYFASLVEAGKAAGVDTDTIIQSYNFGGGYITYVSNNYNKKHSEEAARAFSSMMAARMGWSNYGDVKYVEHVRSFMNMASEGDAIENYDRMYAMMKEYEGVPYVFGGESKSGIDCSAMSQKLYQSIGITLPRVANDQYNAVNHVSESEAKPGDLIFFTGTYDAGAYITHVGVYTGNGQFFHAGGSHCQFSSLSGYYRDHFAGFGRY